MGLLDPDASGVITGLCLFLAGHFMLRFSVRGSELRGDARVRGPLEWSVTALMVGAAILPALVIALTWLFGPLSVLAGRLLVFAPAVLGLALLLWPGLLGSAPTPGRLGSGDVVYRFRGEAPKSALELAGFALLGVATLAILFAAFSSPVHAFDPVFHFAYKGKILFTEGFSAEAWSDLTGPVGRVMTHPTYPPGVPALEVLASYPLGEFSATAGRGLMALFVLAPAAWLFAAMRSVTFRSGASGRVAGLLAALLWVTLPILFYIRLPHAAGGFDAVWGLVFGPGDSAGVVGSPWRATDGPSLDGGGDLPLAGFVFGALLHLWRLLPGTRGEGDRADIFVAGALLGAAVLAKNEGLALFAVLVIAVGLVVCARRIAGLSSSIWRELAPLGLASAFAILMISPWFVIKAGIPTIDESYFDLVQPAHLVSAVFTERPNGELSITIVSREFLKTFLDPLHWNMIWVLFAGYLLHSLRRPVQLLGSDAVLPLLFVVGGLLAFFLILAVTPWPLGQLFTTGIPDRLFLQLAPTAIFATVLIAWPKGREGGGGE